MEKILLDMNDKIRIGGIKLSHEMAQVNLLKRSEEENSAFLFFQRMAENRINLPFISYIGMKEEIEGTCCVAAQDTERVKDIVALDPDLKDRIEFIAPVGSLSVFPHQYKLKLLGLLLFVFGKAGIPVYGMATSISAITVITDYRLLDRAAETLVSYLELPPHHTPFKPEIQVKQI